MKKTAKMFTKILAMAMLTAFALFCLVGCGKELSVTITDAGVDTQLSIVSGSTVEDALKAAQITLGEKDEVTPAANAKITDDGTQIIVKRFAAVTVTDGDVTFEAELVGGTVADALAQAGITLNDGDSVSPDEMTYLTDGMTITVNRGYISVTLTVNGQTSTVSTSAATVGELLSEQNLTVGAEDRLNMDVNAALENGAQIVLDRVETKEVTETETIPFETEKKKSDSLKEGSEKVTQKGADGEKTVTYKVTYVNGIEEGREQISEEITKQPVTEIITIGAKAADKQASSSAPNKGTSSKPAESSKEPSKSEGGRTVVSKQKVEDCDGSGHGYYIIKYSDGTVEYEDF